MRKCVYIEKGGKCEISAKNNTVHRFTKCVNRFRQLNYKQADYEDWYASDTFWIDSNVPRWRLIRFNQSQKVFMWYYLWKLWINTLWCYSWKFSRFKRCDTRKVDIKNAWYESMNHESNQAIQGRIFYMTTHKTLRDHMTQWNMVC